MQLTGSSPQCDLIIPRAHWFKLLRAAVEAGWCAAQGHWSLAAGAARTSYLLHVPFVESDVVVVGASVATSLATTLQELVGSLSAESLDADSKIDGYLEAVYDLESEPMDFFTHDRRWLVNVARIARLGSFAVTSQMYLLPEHADGKAVDTRFWRAALTIACSFGWKPAGTTLDIDVFGEENGLDINDMIFVSGYKPEWWDGRYWGSNIEMNAVDARNFAAALLRAAPDCPRHDCVSKHRNPMLGVVPDEGRHNPFEWFSGENRRWLFVLAELCQHGGIHIS
jgi:hypothetical protein